MMNTSDASPCQPGSDNLTSVQRRRAMQAVQSSNTSLERRVREVLEETGIRFNEQARLPGRPDFIVPELGAAIFVHGCFWHGHECRPRTPRANREYWERKLGSNRARDRRVRRRLNQLGWSVFVLWGCRIRNHSETERALRRLLRRATSPTCIGARRTAQNRTASDGPAHA